MSRRPAPMARRRRRRRARKPRVATFRTLGSSLAAHLRPHARAIAGTAALGIVIAAAGLSVGPASARLAESSWLRVRAVELEGHSYLSRAEVLGDVETLLGRNPLTVDTDSLAAALSRHPRVRHASVKCTLLGSLRVEVEERVAKALVVEDGEPVEIDREGVRLPPAPGRVTRDLVLLTGARAGGDAGVRAGLALLGALRDRSSSLEHRLSEIDVSSPRALVGYTVEDEIRIEFGPDDLHAQAERLAIVLERSGSDPIAPRRIDLRFGKRVFVEPGAGDEDPFTSATDIRGKG